MSDDNLEARVSRIEEEIDIEDTEDSEDVPDEEPFDGICLPAGTTTIGDVRILTVHGYAGTAYVETDDGVVRPFTESDEERFVELLDEARMSQNDVTPYEGPREEPFTEWGGPHEYLGLVKGIHVWNDGDGDAWIVDEGGNASLFWDYSHEDQGYFLDLLDEARVTVPDVSGVVTLVDNHGGTAEVDSEEWVFTDRGDNFGSYTGYGDEREDVNGRTCHNSDIDYERMFGFDSVRIDGEEYDPEDVLDVRDHDSFLDEQQSVYTVDEDGDDVDGDGDLDDLPSFQGWQMVEKEERQDGRITVYRDDTGDVWIETETAWREDDAVPLIANGDGLVEALREMGDGDE